MTHRTRRYGDQLTCNVCGCSWDHNEAPPNECIPLSKPSAPLKPYKNFTVKSPQRPPEKKSAGRMITSQDFQNLREALETDDWSKFF